MDSSEASEPRFSERFRDPNADVTLSSCDGILFKFYRRNLEVRSGAFSSVETLVGPPTEIVNLAETSEVVENLLRLMSPRDPPDLTSLEFRILAPLADAVEKYQVFSAMTACDLSMRTAIPDHSTEVLEYAVKHNRVDTMNAAALESVGLRMSEVKKHLSPEVFVAWARYLELWLGVLEDVHNNDRRMYHDHLSTRRSSYNHSRIGARVVSLKDFVFTDQLALGTHTGGRDFQRWSEHVKVKVSKVPKFSTIL